MTGNEGQAQSIPSGLKLVPEVIDPVQEAALLETCSRCDLAYYEQDPGNPRSRKSFGWEYDITGGRFHEGDPMPEGFRELRDIAARFAGVAPDDIIDCMVIRYEPGALIQPHFDKPVFKDIVGLSLAADADMVFSKPDELGGDAITVTLPRRSIYKMSGDARFVYRHGIPRIETTRWSVTFRTLTPAGEALRASFA